MKLRFDKNSIRLRVKKSDLEKLHEKKVTEEKINFPDGEFVYILSVSHHSKEISAAIKQSSVEVTLPHEVAHEWMNNDEVGIYHTIVFGNNSLEVIIEKDFPCKHDKTEDKTDAFIELAKRNEGKGC